MMLVGQALSGTACQDNSSAATVPFDQVERIAHDLPGITRALIPSTQIPDSTEAFFVTGFAAHGDAGAGALYVRGSDGFMPIADAAGTTFSLSPVGGVLDGGHWGCLGGDGSIDEAEALSAFFADVKKHNAARGGFVAARLPPGIHRTSAMVTLDTLWRGELIADGAVIAPFGKGPAGADDFLLLLTNETPDPLYPTLAGSCTLRGLRIDGEYKSRCMRYHQYYSSHLYDLYLDRCYGTSLWISGTQEVQWHGLNISHGKHRDDGAIMSAATPWDSNTIYTRGQYVYYKAAVWSAGTLYAKGDIASDAAFNYVSARDDNRNQPVSDRAYWIKLPEWEYFQAVAPPPGKKNQDKSPGDPLTDHTLRSPNEDNRFWRQVFPSEVGLRLEPFSKGAGVSNVKFFGLDFRNCDYPYLVRIASPHDADNVSDLAFYAPQMHTLTDNFLNVFNDPLSPYPTRFAGNGVSPEHIPSPEDSGWAVLWALHATNIHFTDGNYRNAGGWNGIHIFRWGAIGAHTDISRVHLNNTVFNGVGVTGNRIAQIIMPSVSPLLHWFESSLEYILASGTNNLKKFDPRGSTVFRQSGVATVRSGTASVVVTFEQRVAGTPSIKLTAADSQGGLSMYYANPTREGFALHLSGNADSDVDIAWEAELEPI